jgi:DNA replication and repair protein RecF
MPYARKRYEAIAGGGRLDVAYSGSWLPTDSDDQSAEALSRALAGKLAEVAAKEKERGVSLVGPQRDDVEVRLVDKDGDGTLRDARLFASQGDQRTIALGLKTGEFDLLCDVLGDDPLLLLDDVFSELDPARREWLLESVGRVDQTVVTSAEAVALPVAARRIEVSRGRIHPGG